MKKIKIDGSWIAITLVLSIFVWVMGSMMPLRTWLSEDTPRTNQTFKCEMVDGKIRDFTLNLPINVEWYIGSNRGTYYVQFEEPGINLFGKKAWASINEGCIYGVLTCRKVK